MSQLSELFMFAVALFTAASQAGPAEAPTTSSLGSQDRVYAAEQFSNTVSVTDPTTNRLLGVIRLGDPQPGNFSPLYKGQLLVHGMGASPDGDMLAVVSIGSNAVSFIDTTTNRVLHTTYVGRSPHEANFTADGREVWVTVRGEDYVSVIDAASFQETARIRTAIGPGMTVFSADGRYAYICSSFTAETAVVTVADHEVVARIPQPSPFCPNLAVSPDGRQVWITLKDVGKVMAFEARPPFRVLRTIDTGPITNHVNFVTTRLGQFAWVTVGGLNQVQVFRTDTFERVATIPVGRLPHGVWPSSEGSRIYVGLENGDALAVIDTTLLRMIAEIPIGQAPQALVYVANAVRRGDGLGGLEPLGVGGRVAQLTLAAPGRPGEPTSVSLFDQGLIQVLEASVTGLQPRQFYVLALAARPDGSGPVEPLASFTTNPAGAAIVNAAGAIRQVVQDRQDSSRRYLVIATGTPERVGRVVQVQVNPEP